MGEDRPRVSLESSAVKELQDVPGNAAINRVCEQRTRTTRIPLADVITKYDDTAAAEDLRALLSRECKA